MKIFVFFCLSVVSSFVFDNNKIIVTIETTLDIFKNGFPDTNICNEFYFDMINWFSSKNVIVYSSDLEGYWDLEESIGKNLTELTISRKNFLNNKFLNSIIFDLAGRVIKITVIQNPGNIDHCKYNVNNSYFSTINFLPNNIFNYSYKFDFELDKANILDFFVFFDIDFLNKKFQNSIGLNYVNDTYKILYNPNLSKEYLENVLIFNFNNINATCKSYYNKISKQFELLFWKRGRKYMLYEPSPGYNKSYPSKVWTFYPRQYKKTVPNPIIFTYDLKVKSFPSSCLITFKNCSYPIYGIKNIENEIFENFEEYIKFILF